MPRPVLPDTTSGVLRDHERRHNRSAGGSALLEIGDPAGPPVVTGLGLTSTVQTDAYGRDTATILAQWTAVPSDTSESADPAQAPVKDYLVGFSTDGGSSWAGDASTEATAARFTGQRVGKRFDVRVRARTTAGVTGPYSYANITTATDNTAPPKISRPIVTQSQKFLKAISVEWDGKNADGSAPPDDLRHLELWVGKENPPGGSPGSTTASAPALNYIGNVDRTERRYTFPTPDYSTYYAQFRGVDQSNNKGQFSDVSDGAKGEQVVTDDVAKDIQIKARAAGTFGGGNGVLNSSFEAFSPTSPDAQGNPQGGGPEPFRHWTTAGSVSATDTGGFHGKRRARLGRPGGQVSFVQSNGIPVAEDTPAVVSAWVRLDSAGLTPRVDLVSSSGPAPVLMDNPPAEYRLDSSKAGTWQRIATFYKSQPRGGTVHVRVLLDGGPDGSIDVDAVQYEIGDYVTAYAPNVEELLPGTIGPTQIAPGSVTSEKVIAGAIVAGKIQADAVGANEIRAGAITARDGHLENGIIVNAKIRDLAVDNAKIADGSITTLKTAEISAERISTGTLKAGTRIVAGDPGGNHVQMDEDGIHLVTYRNGYEEVVVGLDIATASGRFKGSITASTITGSTIRTGDSGNYIRLSDLSNRDKIQFVRNDPGYEYVSGTITSITGGIQIDGSQGDGGGGRILLGSGNQDRIDYRGRRTIRSTSPFRAGSFSVEIPTGGADVSWPGGGFPSGMVPNLILAQMVANTGGSAIGLEVANPSENGCRLYATVGGSRVYANREVYLYAESFLSD